MPMPATSDGETSAAASTSSIAAYCVDQISIGVLLDPALVRIVLGQLMLPDGKNILFAVK